VSAVEGCDVGGVDGMDQVPCREYSGPAGPQARVDQGAEAATIEFDSGRSCKFVVRYPIPGEHNAVAFNKPADARVDVLNFDPLKVWAADDACDAGTGGDRDP
jgi:hypothetical protein